MIIPAYNEEAYLPRLFGSVQAARFRYDGRYDAIEILLVDNASTDATVELARSYGCRVIREQRRIIAAARNTGARHANGEIIVFTDADSIIHPETFNAIEQHLEKNVIAGSTGVKMERFSFGIAATYALLVPLVWLTGMDTGVVFCRREDFEAVGGYNEDRLFAEDVQFLWDLKRLGRRRGQKLVRLRSAKAIFSTRKFDAHGDWHYLRLIALFILSLSISKAFMKKIAHTYWYGEQRKRNS